MSLSITLAPDPDPAITPAPPPGTVLLAPSFEKGTHRFAEGPGAPVLEMEILYPIDLQTSHGVKITAEDLQAMVASYDPAKEVAVLNFDHAWGGPAHGQASRVWMEGDRFWGRFEKLSAEVVEGIRAERWPRRSAELTLSHPVFRVPYFRGLALLGASPPAVPGLAPARLLMSQPITVFDLEAEPETPVSSDAGAESTASITTPEGGGEGEAMSEQTPPAPEPAPAIPAAQEPETQPDDGNVDLAAEREQIAADRAQAAALLAEARRERAATRVDTELAKLASRVTPAMLRGGLKELLVELAAAETPQTVKLSAGADRPALDILLDAFRALPDLAILGATGAAHLADPDDAPADGRSPEERALHASAGVADTRYLELKQKYGIQ